MGNLDARHSGARGLLHVRLLTPRAWRIDEYARHELVERSRAVKAIDHDDTRSGPWSARLILLRA
jgi:hypothetical protein